MRTRRFTSAIIAAMVWPLLSASAAFAQAPARPHPADGSQGDLVKLVLIGPFVLALIAGAYALISVCAILIKREQPLTEFLSECSVRLDNSRIPLTVWGIAVLLVLLFLGFFLCAIPATRILGILVFVFTLLLGSMALASIAKYLGSRWGTAEGRGLENVEDHSPLATGLWLMAGTAAIPFAGWLIAVAALLTGLGAVVERLVARARKQQE